MAKRASRALIAPEEMAACLRRGGVVLVPTDTVYGLAALPSETAAVERVFELKQRPLERRLPLMISSPDQLLGIGANITPAAARLFKSKYVPGPLTIAVGFLSTAMPTWLAGRDEVAVRIPDDDFLLTVLGLTGPLFVTSANAHGQSSPATVDEALHQLNGVPDLVVDGEVKGSVPSTLVNCRVDPPVVERVGRIAEAQIRELLK